jgi:hypothetical protein
MNNTRTALYYPEIIIPSKVFIRKAILYWDDIGSIVPKTIWDEHPYFDLGDQETNQLRDAHLYRPFFPHTLMYGRAPGFEERFSSEFYRRLDFFNQRDRLKNNTQFTPVYEEKEMVPGLFQDLETRGLAKSKVVGKISISESGHPVYFIESVTANIYMALLAESLAEADNNITLPVTEDSTWQDYTYSAITPNNQKVGARLVLDRIIPTPSPDVPLDKLIDFKESHKTELIQLRKSIDEFQTSISDATDIRAAKDSCCKFSEDFESGVRDIDRNLHDRNIKTVLGSLNSLLDLKSPEISGTLITSGALALGTLQPLFLLSGIIMAASIKIEVYLLKEREVRRKLMESLPYSYVYHLQKSGLVAH